MESKKSLLNNFLITDAKDGAIRINCSQKFTRDVYSNIESETYDNFTNNPNIISLSLSANKDLIWKITNKAKTLSSVEELKDLLIKNNIKLTKAKLESIAKNFQDKNKLFTILGKEINSIFKQLVSMTKFAKNKLKEDGVWSLYLCHGFLKGRIQDGTFIKAPLVLIPVEVKQSEDKFVISKISEPIYNEKLNFLVEINYGINVNTIFEKSLDEINQITVKKILSIYSTVFKSINVNLDVNHKLQKYKSEDIDELSNISDLIIDYSIALSLLDPTGGKAKKDIIEILERNENPFATYSILKNNSELEAKIANSDFIVEINKPLNIYQKYAVASALEDNTIIFGPPGTGKSEVIVNIVANIIKQNKSCMIVSEKKAALDVLHNRLKALNKISLNAYDVHDSSSFYGKINQLQLLISSSINEFKFHTWESRYEQLKANYLNIKKISDVNIYSLDLNEIVKSIEDNGKTYNEQTNLIINELDKIIKEKKISLLEGFNIMGILKNLTKNYDETLVYLKENKLVDLKYEKISKFLSKYEKSKDKEFLISNFVFNQKINNKTLINKLFKTNIERVEFDKGTIIKFLKEIEKLSIQSINIDALLQLQNIELNFDQFRAALIQKGLIDNIVDVDFDSFQDEFEKYIEYKSSIAKNNDEVILNRYLINFVKIYNNISEAERHEIDDMFSRARMKRKQNVNIFATKFFNKLKLIFPIWILNPNRASIIIPNKKDVFDYGIYDEASQMFLKNAFSLVYRAKINVVSGDDKQLKPTSFFGSRYESNDLELSQDDAESLLERAKLCLWPSFHLKNHYRCESESLIKFSAENFYNNQLEYTTKNESFKNSIDVIDVKGTWKDETNEMEVKKVIDLLYDNWDKYNTIMIITLNKKQLDAIEKAFIRSFADKREIFTKYEKDLILFKNLENCQGHESDLVILSLGYGYNSENKFTNFFGPISQSGGSNRLNVAITRAKKKIMVVKSFKASDMKINEENPDSLIFYKYINFLDNHKTNKLFNKIDDRNENDKKRYVKDVISYTENLIKKNSSKHFKVISDIKIGSCYIDYAVFNNDSSKILLAINFDRVFDQKSFQNTLHNIYRQKFLEDRGYNVINVDEIEWYFKNKIIKKLISKKIDEMLLKYEV